MNDRSVEKDSTPADKQCPFKYKCYRKNPIHFRELSHPDFECLVINQLDDNVVVPDNIGFESPDPCELLQQLRIVQTVLKEKRERDGISFATLQAKLSKLTPKPRLRTQSSTSNDNNVPNTSSGSKRSNANEEDHISGNSKMKKSKNRANQNVSGETSLVEQMISRDSQDARLALREKTISMMKAHGHKISVAKVGEFGMKFALAAPYHFFLTRVEKCHATYDQTNSISFPEILDISLGEIQSSLQLSFVVDVGWLCLQYLLAAQKADMLILYGDRADTEPLPPNIELHRIEMPTAYGCHHSKLMILKYKDGGIRIVVGTANLYADDWENRTQGLWMSPHLPPLPEDANPNDGESPTKFKWDIQQYLIKYKIPELTDWISLIRRADFSSVNVFLVASVPGSHKEREVNSWGHKKLTAVLSQHVNMPRDSPYWPIVAISSSIGNLGPQYSSWLQKEIVTCMSSEKGRQGLTDQPEFHFIYPTIENFKNSYDMREGSCCFLYSIESHNKQRWILNHMHKWKAQSTARDKAMPHIKCYTRMSPDMKEISWFLLTSANLSKAAWGQHRYSHYLMNYEIGVAFVPSIITGGKTFPIKDAVDNLPVFPIPYDLPLTPYGPDDKPFVIEFFKGYE
ncbi:probable tyrosyl-DNA phosphodiesterase [Cephus cinctus]|uniref:Probable tyrosyl-DNA phosphodiesterase n=1 Tax=Cephus cinctus TaxID=211228 RepID=A0AAJ7BSK8_CEPCN|nr:probable tyrosyl-DNA phosphodiesterase [Cephus cinctus]XP_024939880.1 probable tyrosyl-DNA phosphodiesterase [Cephus cinctus]